MIIGVPTLVADSLRMPLRLPRPDIVASLSALRDAAVAAPRAAVRAATSVLDSGLTGRRVWSAVGRAQIEVRGLDGESVDDVVHAVEEAVGTLDGVEWAQVDVVTRRLTVRFDADQITIDDLCALVRGAEETTEVADRRYPKDAPDHPGDPQAVTLKVLSLAADVAGLSVAVAGRLTRLPALPGSSVAAVVLVDNQPRLRRLLESRLGPSGSDLALAVTNAAVHGLTQGVPSLLVDTASRAQAVLAARARSATFTEREAELAGPARPMSSSKVTNDGRPLPLPPGPIERLADRAAVGTLIAASGLLVNGRAHLAGRAVQIAAPRAARTAREAFADSLGVRLARRGVVLVDDAALRRLDRVTAILIESSVLHNERMLVFDAVAHADHWTREHVWAAAQRLLRQGAGALPLPPPQGRHRHRLELRPVNGAPGVVGTAVTWLTLVEDGREVGGVAVGGELDPFTDAILKSARDAGLRVALTADAAAAGLAAQVDEQLSSGTPLQRKVRAWQAAGEVVAVVGSDEAALAAADLGIGIVPSVGRVPWAADVLVGPGIHDVPRLLSAIPVARSVCQRGVTLAVGATFLGALITAVGGRRQGGRAVLPITAAAGSALLSGTFAAWQVDRAAPPEPVPHIPWHALEADEVLARLGAPAPPVEDGPAPARILLRGAARSLTAVASNIRAELADPLTPVLATGAAASAVIGSPTDALLVGSVLTANAVISGLQRWRADRALRELLLGEQVMARLSLLPAKGLHGPELPGTRSRLLPATRLRPGMVVELQAGDVVPADLRILTESDLEVDEATLTGESIAVPKQVQSTPGVELADQACLVFEGTTVLAGRGSAVVVAVGSATQAGRALALASRSGGPAGMQARLEQLTRRTFPVTLLGGAAVALLATLRLQRPAAAIASGVSVAVAAVPEGLPLVATVAQLGAARRLSHRGVLVRSARTVEALGRVDTICFDKTGTLTEGRLRLARVADVEEDWAPTDLRGRRVLLAAARACPRPEGEHQAVHATDQAVLDAATALLGADLDDGWQELAELPFHSERGFSAAVGRTRTSVRFVVKGAPEVLLPRCSFLRDDHGKRPLDVRERAAALTTVQRLAGRGLRVLAVARRNMAKAAGDVPADYPAELVGDLTLLGFLALADVARPGAAKTVADLQEAGLSVVMITGDHPVTAQAIAESLRVPADHVVTGPELATADESARLELVRSARVFARVSPEQKLRIVTTLQSDGRVVAMTGDGANDAAAIRVADVGIGMAARGSSSARSAADLVLAEPDVSLLPDALIEGRAMWRRVRDAVAILIGGNAGEVAFTLAGTALGGRAPLGTRQFLLVNMLTDLLPAMAIAVAPTPDSPSDRARLLSEGAPSLGRPLLTDIGVRGLTTSAGALGAWAAGRVTGTRRRASTMALAALVGTQLGQTLVVGGRDPLVAVTAIGSSAVLAAIIQTPFVSQFFGCTPLDPVAWALVLGWAAGATAASTILSALLARRRPLPPP